MGLFLGEKETSMKNRIEKYLIERSEDLVFITIEESGELNLDGYEVPLDGLKDIYTGHRQRFCL